MDSEKLSQILLERAAQDGSDNIEGTLCLTLVDILSTSEPDIEGINFVGYFATTSKTSEVWILTTKKLFRLPFTFTIRKGLLFNQPESLVLPIECANTAWTNRGDVYIVGPNFTCLVAQMSRSANPKINTLRDTLVQRIHYLRDERASIDPEAPITCFYAGSLFRATGLPGAPQHASAVVVAYRDRLSFEIYDVGETSIPLSQIRSIDIGGPGRVVQQTTQATGYSFGMVF